ncbi:hypothetical protein ACSQ67_023486 [Phaseolus vulgaris]
MDVYDDRMLALWGGGILEGRSSRRPLPLPRILLPLPRMKCLLINYLRRTLFVTSNQGQLSCLNSKQTSQVLLVDPFAEANAEDSGAGTKEYVHVRVQQRNGRKSLTTVQGLKKEYSYSKILKDLKKEFCCNGTVVQDPELGQVIQLQGDQRKNVSTFLMQAGIVKKEHIKLHGF